MMFRVKRRNTRGEQMFSALPQNRTSLNPVGMSVLCPLAEIQHAGAENTRKVLRTIRMQRRIGPLQRRRLGQDRRGWRNRRWLYDLYLLADFPLGVPGSDIGLIVRSTGNHTGEYQAVNLIGKSTKESSRVEFVSKKSGILDANGDTLRQRYGDHKSYPR
jgi:hypothetical protein